MSIASKPRTRREDSPYRRNRPAKRVPGKKPDQSPLSGLLTGKNANFLTGFGAGVLAAMLFPSMMKTLRPVALSAIHGINSISDQIKETTAGFKENLEDLVSEAQFERFKTQLDQEIARNQSQADLSAKEFKK